MLNPIYFFAKILIFIENKAFVYRFARDLSNFCQKQGCDITKKMILHKYFLFFDKGRINKLNANI